MNPRMSALSDEITLDPLARGYAGMTDSAAADSLNERNRPGPIESLLARRYLLLVGKWAPIADDASNHLVADNRRACRVLVDTLDAFETIDMADALVAGAVNAALDALVTLGYLTAGDKAALLALGDNLRTRAEEIGAGSVTAGAVGWVRNA